MSLETKMGVIKSSVSSLSVARHFGSEQGSESTFSPARIQETGQVHFLAVDKRT